MQQEHPKKSRRFSKRINNCAPALPFFFSFFYADYHVKFPNFTWQGGRKQTMIWNWVVRIRLQENFALERTYSCGFLQRANTKLL